MQGKQAKIVSPTQERAILGYLDTTRYPSRDRVMFLLSMKAGLRAKEMASLTWAMVTDAAGQVAEVMHVPNRASKGTTGGRTIPLHPDLQAALVTLQTGRGDMATPERLILFSERGGGLSPATVRESAKFRGDPLQQWALRHKLCAWNNTKHTRTSISRASSCEASVRSSGVGSWSEATPR